MTAAESHRGEDPGFREKLAARIRGKAKPIGALGRLEELAIQIGMITGSFTPAVGPAKVLVFAGDHGITAEGVTAYPSEVTREIAKLVLGGGAGINVIARAVGVDVLLIDSGLLEALPDDVRLLAPRIGKGTRNFCREPAMTYDECQMALAAGRAVDASLGNENIGVVAYGEIGIGNTSAAAAIAHVLTGIELSILVGAGAGAPSLGLAHKRQIISEAVARAGLGGSRGPERAFEALRQFGGFEIVMMAGSMLAAAEAGRVIVVDGFISTAAALAACQMAPSILQNCIFAHCSAEEGHKAVLDHLGVRPLLQLDMRLGEGTGATLAIPLVRAAALMLSEMADLPGEHPT